MDEPVEQVPCAWQPITPRGVAGFARAPLRRLWLVQVIVALAVAGVGVCCLRSAWFPTITEAVAGLPEQGEIRSGALNWMGDSPVMLAEGRFLAMAVDLEHEGEARSPADVQVEFGRRDIELFSLLGFVRFAYPARGAWAFNRTELAPWWGAWRPAVLAVTAAVVVLGLTASWALLASLYCLVPWVLAFFGDRELDLRASWRLAGAALMPGALVFAAGIAAYGLGLFDLVKLGGIGAAHLVVGWIYLIWCPFALPRRPKAGEAKANPFGTPAKENVEAKP